MGMSTRDNHAFGHNLLTMTPLSFTPYFMEYDPDIDDGLRDFAQAMQDEMFEKQSYTEFDLRIVWELAKSENSSFQSFHEVLHFLKQK